MTIPLLIMVIVMVIVFESSFEFLPFDHRNFDTLIRVKTSKFFHRFKKLSFGVESVEILSISIAG